MKKSRFPLIAAAAVVVLLIFAGLVCSLFEAPKKIAPLFLTPEDIRLQYRIVQQVMKTYGKKNPPRTITFELTPAEVNSAFRILGSVPAGKLPLRYYEPMFFPDGSLSFTYPADTGWRWLNGGVFRLRGKVAVEKEKEFSLRVLQARGAWIELPVSRIQSRWDELYPVLKEKKNFQLFMNVVESLRFDGTKKKLIVVCRPQEMLRMFSRR